MKSLFSLWQHRSIHLVRCGRLGHAAVQGRIHCESWSCQGCWAHVCAHSDCCMYYRSSSLCSLLSKFESDFFLARVHRPRSFANDQSSLASYGLSRPITVQAILSSFCVGVLSFWLCRFTSFYPTPSAPSLISVQIPTTLIPVWKVFIDFSFFS